MPNTLVWNNITYHAVTDWYRSSAPDGYVSWLYPAVRFLIGEDSTASSAHVIAQYGSYTTQDPIPFSTASGNNYLDQCLNSAPTTGSNQAGSEWFADNAQGKFFTIDNTVQACGYPRTTSRALPITDNIMSYGRPYVVTDFRRNGQDKGPGETVTSKLFYAFLSGNYSNARYVQKSYTVESVSITYNGNNGNYGGTTQGSTRIKGWQGCGFTLPIASNGFTAPGTCAFVGWSEVQHPTPYPTKADALAVVDYLPSGTTNPSKPTVYSGDSDITLYAVWHYTYKTVSYNANIPTGVSYTQATVPNSVTAQSTESITIGAAPTVTNMNPLHSFVKWTTNADGSGSSFSPGNSYKAQTSATMYAQWYIDYVPPAFTSVSVQRSNNSGTYQVDGEYLHVSGGVVVNPTTILTNKPYSLTISWTDPTGTSVGSVTINQSDFTNNNFNWVSNTKVLDPGKTYTVTLTFKDTFINTYPNFRSPITMSGLKIGVAFITFSTNARGHSAAFGQQAVQTVSGDPDTSGTDAHDGRLDVYMNTYFHGNVSGITIPTVETATTSVQGIVQIPTDTSITIDGNGVIHGLYCTEKSGGTKLDTVISSGGSGWREEKWSDGRLTLYVWQRFYVNSNTTQWTMSLPASSAATLFTDFPFPQVTAHDCGNNDADAVSIKTLTKSTSSTQGSAVVTIRYTNSVHNIVLCLRLDGHWT